MAQPGTLRHFLGFQDPTPEEIQRQSQVDLATQLLDPRSPMSPLAEDPTAVARVGRSLGTAAFGPVLEQEMGRLMALTPEGQYQGALAADIQEIERQKGQESVLKSRRERSQFFDLSGLSPQEYGGAVSNIRGVARGVEYAETLLNWVDEYGTSLAVVPDEVQGRAEVLAGMLLNSARVLFEAGALQQGEIELIRSIVGDPTTFSLSNLTGKTKGRLTEFAGILRNRMADMQLQYPQLANDQPGLFAVPQPRGARPVPQGFQEFTP